MKTFYDMLCLLEQSGQLASVERFPQDFERVLNFIVGGHWGFIADKDSPIISVTNEIVGELSHYMQVKYRGMSDSGRHYSTLVSLHNPVGKARGEGLFKAMSTWAQKSSYNTTGSSGVADGSPVFYFLLHEIRELGPDTYGTPEKEPDKRSAWERVEDEKRLTVQQRELDRVIGMLGEIERDIPKRKQTQERELYRNWGGGGARNTRPVDLARQIREEIAKHERSSSGFGV